MPRASMASVYVRVTSSPKLTNRRNRIAMCRGWIGTRRSGPSALPLGDRPAVLWIDQPGDEGADGVRQRFLDRAGRRLERTATRSTASGTGSATIAGCESIVVPVGGDSGM